MITKPVFAPLLGAGLVPVTSGLTPGEITGGTPNTFAGFDGLGALESLPNWSVSTDTTGANFNVTLTPANPNATWVINNYVSSITPVTSLTQLSFQAYQNYVYLNGPNDHASTIVSNNGLQTDDTGYHGDIRIYNSDMTLGDGTNVSTSGNHQFLNANVNVRANHTATSLTGLNMYYQVDGDIGNNLNMASFQANINSPFSSGVNGLLIGGNVYDTGLFYTGINIGPNFQTGANLTNSVQIFTDSTHIYTGATVQGVTTIGVYPNFDSGAILTNGYNGINLNPNLNAAMTGSGVNMISGGGTTTAAMDYYNTMAVSPQLQSGATITNGYTGFQDGVNMLSGASANDVTQFAGYANIQAGATLNNYRGLTISPSVNTNLTNLNLASLFANGSGTHTNVTGLSIDLSNVNSTNRRTGININGGVVNFNAMNTTASSLGVDGSNSIVPTLTVTTPITGTSFISNNFSSLFDIQDDFAIGAIPGIGVVGVGFVGQVQVASGKTLAALSWALSGAQVGGAGTITDYTMYDALGAIPVGTTTITNMYGFRGHQFLNGATNVWGISIEEPTAENYFEKSIAIGTTSHKVGAAGTGLEILTKDFVLDGGDQYITAMTANGVVTNDTAGKLISVAPGSSGNVLTSSGGAWVSAPAGGGGFTPVATTTVTASSGTTITGLDGNTDKAWKIILRGTIVTPNGVPYSLRPNNDSTAGAYQGAVLLNYSLGTPITAGWNSDRMEIGRGGFGTGVPNDINAIIDFAAEVNGFARVMSGRTAIYGAAQPFGAYYDTGGGWTDLTSNITSLAFDFSGGSGGTFTGTITIYRSQYA